MTRSGALVRISAKFLQVARCIDTPLPRVTKPTMPSGGAGLQHLASAVIRPSVPTTSTPDLAPCSTLDARLLLSTTASSGSVGSAWSCNACSTWRRLNSSLPTARNRSSTLAKPSLLASASRLTAVLPSRCRFLDHRAAVRQRLLHVDGVEPGADFRARAVADGVVDVEPVARRAGRAGSALGSDDLAGLAVFQRR